MRSLIGRKTKDFVRGFQLKLIIIFLILAAVLSARLWVPFLGEAGLFNKGEASYKTSVTLEDIKQVAELASVEYLMEVRLLIDKPKDKFWIIDIPQTQKLYIAFADGSIKAGIDLQNLQVFRVEDGKAYIKLPPAEILSVYVDPATKWERQFEGVFSEIEPEEITQAQIEAEANMKERAIRNGILQKADENAKIMIKALLTSAGIKEVIFE